jgi:soluble lytic murein transglycosylase-like protein
MRLLLATLALAGALFAAPPPASAQPDQAFPQRVGAMSASDVVNAKRCAPPFGCKRERQRQEKDRRPGVSQVMLALVDDIALEVGVPERIARALVKVESGFNPQARNGSALGLTQIQCRTARGLGFSGPCAALFDPAVNLRFGLRHAALALRRGSIGFHQAGLAARRVRQDYVRKINAARI